MFRVFGTTDGLNRHARVGELINSPLISTIATDADVTYTISQLSGRAILRTSLTAPRSDTLPTAAAILAVNANMDIGDTFLVMLANTSASAITLVTNTGVTLNGNTTIAATSRAFLVITKTSDTTVTATLF
jgi:hypothetical protein